MGSGEGYSVSFSFSDFSLGFLTSGQWPSCQGGCAASSPSWWRRRVGEGSWPPMSLMWYGYSNVYCSHNFSGFQASESLFNSLHKKGLVPKMKYGNPFLLISEELIY